MNYFDDHAAQMAKFEELRQLAEKLDQDNPSKELLEKTEKLYDECAEILANSPTCGTANSRNN